MVDLRLETVIEKQSATGDLKLTVEACREVLTGIEATARRSGKALQLSQQQPPPQQPPPRDPRKYNSKSKIRAFFYTNIQHKSSVLQKSLVA